jgi:hypothetical protein
MKYFYTGIFDEQDGRIVPSKNVEGVAASSSEDLTAGVKSLKCDQENARFVVQTYDDFTGLDGWVPTTKEEVNTTYPGLIE